MPDFDHFGILAPYYDHVIQLRQPEKLIQLAGLPVTGSLLDAGGGTGRVAQALQGMAGSLVVADLSLGMLHQASAKKGLKPVCAHTEKLPFFDSSFECVIMVDALHHVLDHAATAGELFRVLKPGGKLVIGEPDINKVSVKIVALAEKLLLMRSHFLAPMRIQRMFEYPNAQTYIEQDGFNVWVIVEKF